MRVYPAIGVTWAPGGRAAHDSTGWVTAVVVFNVHVYCEPKNKLSLGTRVSVEGLYLGGISAWNLLSLASAAVRPI